MKRIEIIKRDVAPVWVKIIGILIVMATIYKMVTFTFFGVNPLVYIISNALVVGAWTAKEIVVIDVERKEVGEGYKVIGLRHLDWIKYSGIEKVFINKTNSTETFRHLTRTIDIDHTNYKAFLKTNEGAKICIGISDDKDNLINQLKQYNVALRTTIFDSTSGMSIEVE